MAIKKEKFFEIIRNVSESEGLNKDNLLERIGSELKGVNSGVYSTYNNLKIDKMFSILDSDKTVNCMLLHLAVECNSVPIVKLLLAKGVKVNKPTHELDGVKSQLTALHIAALHGHQEIVQLLLNNDANPLLKDSQGRTPRDIVGDVKGKKAIIEMLEEGEQRYAEAGATRRQNRQGTLPQPNNKTPANLAVNGNNATAAVQACNARDQEENNGTTPNNRKIYVQDEDEQTSSNSIVNENNTDKVDDTLEREQAIRERDAMLQKLREAEQRLANNQKRIEQDYLHDQHLEQYTIHNGEQTFLNKSSSDDSGICFDGDGSEALGQSILENGEDIDAQDKDGVTPLHWAVADNNEESVKLFVTRGAKVDVQDKDELTPLHYAATYGYVEIAEYLIDNGAGVDAQDKDGVTPLHYAAAKSAKESVKLLIKRKANVNAQDKDGHTPLYFAVAKDNKELAKLLIKYGADRSLIKDEGLVIDRLNSVCDQPSEVVSSTSSHSKTHNATETPEEAEKVKKSKVKSKELRAQLKEENQSLKRKIQDLESEKATLKDKLDKTKTKEVLLEKKQKELKNDIAGQEARLEALEQEIQELGNENTKLKDKLDKTESQYSKAEALLEKTQKELAESKSCIVGHETKLKQFNKENESLTQKIKSLENENTPLEGELGKTKTNEVSLEKAGKRQFSPKVAYASLAAMLAVGAALSIASGLSALLIVAASVVSALIAGGITYTISKPIAPDTELKEVDIQGSAQRCL
ncbi:ankyrin repeat domain-containing protein [Wolbachia endosymbiont (group A) of Gymnosoma rotundatum]|uniref:ankyrin repeat domain-containing protein n=1 Tax=Wolbachia endosymbiont (group A) of Gymnosoma rotundatum TaxID=2954016 RepID=UPI002226A4D8|nr:ankyrin repeat domain-containing protein [Wolbachia endosymbiont (group A) of Gymnosoma rotundatum]